MACPERGDPDGGSSDVVMRHDLGGVHVWPGMKDEKHGARDRRRQKVREQEEWENVKFSMKKRNRDALNQTD